MARRSRMALATTATLAAVLSGALPTAAGDQRVTGASTERLSFTEDGTPFVRSGPECKAGLGGASKHHDAPDASDY